MSFTGQIPGSPVNRYSLEFVVCWNCPCLLEFSLIVGITLSECVVALDYVVLELLLSMNHVLRYCTMSLEGSHP
jgi:hypothetical protein